MSDLLQILSAGTASLAAQRAAVATASHNIQNANTPGYARQRAVIEATLPAERVGGAWVGQGARLQTIQQARDRFIEAQLPGYLGNAARSQVAASALEAVSALDPEGPGNLGDALGGFYASLRALAQNAGDAGTRQAALGAARTLALAFNRTRAGLEDARTGLDARLAGSLDEVNGLAASVARLNGEIRAARAGGAEPNDLLDARQKAVDQLATLTGAAPVATSDGDVSLFLPGGTALVTSMSAATLSAVGDAANAGHLALRIAQPGGAPRALAAVGGELGGLLDARDGALEDAVSGVDALAFGLAGTVNAAHRAGYGLDGATGRDLLDAGPSADGAAARLSVAAAILQDPARLAASSSATTLPGDGGNALALVETERQAASGGLDPFAALARVTSAFGASAQRLAAAASQDAALKDHLVTMREATSGVSIDEELIEMQKAQRAFEAISKVIQVSNEMFDTLLQLK
jgi:flagellar hook-associated protein 1 FlgK